VTRLGQFLSLAHKATILFALALVAQPAEAAELSLTTSPPINFAELEGPRDVVVDIYFGGRRVGEAKANTRPGFIRFYDPTAVAALLAHYGDTEQIEQAFQVDLPSNVGRACSRMFNSDCGHLQPGLFGVIFDEDRFRVDVFLPAHMADRSISVDEIFLQPSSRDPAAVTSIGAALSGVGGSPSFNFQSRTVLSLGEARLKTNSSYSSELGTIFDDLLIELDKPNRRYAAGLFWTPGTSLVGRRRIMGVGAASQYDTRVDRESLEGTLLPIFVQQTSVVEILIDGRLAASYVVEAGNQLLDTARLPEGSYPLVLRIREPGRGTREEARFFIKDGRLAPKGHVRFQAFAGFIAPTREGHPVSASDTFFYQFGASKRVADNFGVDATILGTQKKAMAEGGIVLLTSYAKLRVSGLASTAGEYGGLLQLTSASSSRVQFSFDLRRVWDKDGDGLIPGAFAERGFDAGSGGDLANQSGDYTQLNATLGYNWGNASLRLYASYSDTEHSKSEFSIGPSVDWLLLHRNRFQLRLEADAQKSRHTTASYAGLRFILSADGLATSGAAGIRTQNNDGGKSKVKGVGSLDAEWSGTNKDLGRYMIGAGIDRAIDATSARARGAIYSQYGNATTDVLHDFQGRTQYSASFQTGAIMRATRVAVGGYNVTESALLIEVEGDPSAGQFEVLVDESPMAKVTAGHRTTLFLQPYRRYDVRIRPLSSSSAHYDAGVRQVTLFPGNVERQNWTAIQTFTIFGQVVNEQGIPIRNGLLQGKYGAGASDDDGFFQIDVAVNDRVTLSPMSGSACELALRSARPESGYMAAGRVVCR